MSQSPDELAARIAALSPERREALARLLERPERVEELLSLLREDGRPLDERAALRARKDLLDRLLEAIAPLVLFVVDQEGRITYASRGAEQMMGLPREELIGRHYLDPSWKVRTPEGEPVTDENAPFRKVLTTGEPLLNQVVVLTDPTGAERTLSMNLTPLFGPNRSVSGVLFAVHDITGEVQREREVADRLRRFRELFDHAPLGIAVLSVEHRRSEFNRVLLRELGYSPEELKGNFLRIVHPDDLEETLRLFREVQEGRRDGYRVRRRHLTKDGRVRWYDVHTRALRDGSGRLQYLISMMADITEAVQSRRALQESEERFRTLFEQAPLGIALLDAQERYLSVNAAYSQIAGRPGAELIGSSPREVLHPEDYQKARELFARMIAENRPFRLEGTRYLRPDGSIAWVSCSVAPVYGSGGEFLYAVVMTRDITEERRTEAERRSLEQRFRTVFEQAPIGIALLGHDGTVLSANPALAELLGYSPTELVGNHVSLYLHPDDHIEGANLFARLVSEGVPYEREARYLHRSGRTIWVLTAVRPVYDADGNFQYAIDMHQDITRIKLAERSLAESEERFRTIFESAPVGMVLFDELARPITANAAFVRMLGYSVSELRERDYLELTHPEDRAETLDRLHRILSGHSRQERYEKRMLRKDGTILWVDLLTTAIRDTHHRLRYLVSILVDITERVRATQELRQLAEELDARVRRRTRELEEANRLLESINQDLRQFAFTISHDFQQPLRTISSFLQLIERRIGPHLEGSDQELLDAVIESAGRLSRMLNGLLRYSQVGRQELVAQPVPLGEVVEEVTRSLRAMIQETGAKVDIEPLPTVYGDRTLLEQLVQNLLENAIKFRGEAPPQVRFFVDSSEGDRVTLAVQDNGVGIPPEDQERIFEVFQRGSRAGERPGTGLGLALCRRIVERHGGKIWLESLPGEGTTVFFTLPTRPLSGTRE